MHVVLHSQLITQCLVTRVVYLPYLRHNGIRDLAAELLRELCHNVFVEPRLQALDGERI